MGLPHEAARPVKVRDLIVLLESVDPDADVIVDDDGEPREPRWGARFTGEVEL